MKSVSIYETNNKTKRLHHIPKRYLPNTLSKSDKRTQVKNLKKSRSLYKKGVYYDRPFVKTFTQKRSKHLDKVKKIYGIKNLNPTPMLARKTGCSISGLKQIIRKGEGAYYSSGSRPNQTPFSWGIARLASAITGGPSSKIDYHILKKECKPNSVALKLSKK